MRQGLSDGPRTGPNSSLNPNRADGSYTFSVVLTPAENDQLCRLCLELNRSKSAIIRDALNHVYKMTMEKRRPKRRRP
ncbi:MAG: hypothetical protein C4570_02115 [Ammonifex sp.]|nr:MAG: hypothetical protein C4570_02115 [Ammonifex sp.]